MRKQKLLLTSLLILNAQSTVAQSPEDEAPIKPVMSSGLKKRETPTAPAPKPQFKAPTVKKFSPSSPTSSSSGAIPKLNMGSYVELDESLKGIPFEGTIDYPDAELTEIVSAISKLANKNFILDSSLKGKRITILSPQKVTNEEAYNVFLTALYMNGLTIVSSGKYLRVIPTREAPKSNVRVFYGDFVPASDEIVTLVYPLKNISAEDMPRIFQDLLPRTGNILVYPETNSVIMTDSGLNMRRMISILKSLDVPGSQPKLESIPINYASSKDLAKMIEEILDAQSGGASRRTSSSRLQKEKKIQGGGVITKIVPDERTNSLVVLANGKGIEQLRSLVAKLDTPNASNSGNIHIYFVKNALAEELATTLNGLLGSGGSTSSTPTRRDANTPNVVSNSFVPSTPVSTRATFAGTDGVALEGQIKVVADKATNSIVVRASSSNYGSLKKILERLDIPRRQVNVEATIMEIRLSDKDVVNLGSNIAMTGLAQAGGFRPSTMSQTDVISAFASPAALNGLIAGFAGGGSVQIEGGKTIKTFTGLLQLVQDTALGQILQQPNILTSDNEPGLVNITEKISVPGDTSVSGSGDSQVVNKKIDRIEVALELKVTPQIGEDNELVKLRVEQSLSDFSKSVSLSDNIDTLTRKATTVVVVRDGDTVAIGGLQKSDVKASRSKMPLLGDLPILGFLFRGSSTDKIRSNLILFLTPRIIKDNTDALELTKMRLAERKKLGKEAYDPKDQHRKNVVRMIRDTDDRLSSKKKGWGFKENTSAYLSNDTPKVAPLPSPPEREEDVKASTILNDEAPAEQQAPAPSNMQNNGIDDLLPMPEDNGAG